MGYKRCAAAPGPLKMLTILDALRVGLTYSQISDRTKYSRSSIRRWHQMYGAKDGEWLADVLRNASPSVLDAVSLENQFPPKAELTGDNLGHT